MEPDFVYVHRFNPNPSHWFWISSSARLIVMYFIQYIGLPPSNIATLECIPPGAGWKRYNVLRRNVRLHAIMSKNWLYPRPLSVLFQQQQQYKATCKYSVKKAAVWGNFTISFSLLAPGATPRQPAVRVAGREKPVAAAMHCGVYAVMQSVRFLLSTLCICTCVFVFVFLYLCINICNHDDSLWCLRSDAIPVVPASRLSAPGIPLQIPSWCRAGQFLTGPPPAHTRIPGILDFIPRPPFIICLFKDHSL